MPLSVTINKIINGNTMLETTGFLFPTTPDALRGALEQLNFTTDNTQQFNFTDIDLANHDIYTKESSFTFPESLTLITADHLKHLAKIIDSLSDEDRRKLFHVYEYASNNITTYPFEDLDDMIDVAHNLDKFAFIPEIENAWQLSDHYIHTSAIDGGDAKLLLAGQMTKQEHGNKIVESEHGGFVTWGYVAGGEGFEPFVMDYGKGLRG